MVDTYPSDVTCASLLREIQIVWDEIGESDHERDRMLLQIEQECLEIYQRKVNITKAHKEELLQILKDSETEIANLVAALGDAPSIKRAVGPLKLQLQAMQPILEELRLKHHERLNKFSEVKSMIESINAEILGNDGPPTNSGEIMNHSDLTIGKLEELKLHLKELQIEQNIRLEKVNVEISDLHELAGSMSLNVEEILAGIHPSLCDTTMNMNKSISNYTLARLAREKQCLKEQKQQKLCKLQEYGKKLTELWNLMDEPSEERIKWNHVLSLASLSADEVQIYGSLAQTVLDEAEEEVERLNFLKASRIKELIMKRQSELELIFEETNMDADECASRQALTDLMESGDADLSNLLNVMDDKILKAKDLASTRKDVLEKMEKWKCATEEEKWLDSYEKDENRYSAGRGAHKNLKRAEKARILSGKIPSLVESLTERIKVWESEKGIPFLIGKVPLSKIITEYNLLRQGRLEEKRRFREQKRLQEQFEAEQEAMYGSRPRKPLGQSINGNTMVATPGRRLATPLSHRGISAAKERRESKAHSLKPINFVALS